MLLWSHSASLITLKQKILTSLVLNYLQSMQSSHPEPLGTSVINELNHKGEPNTQDQILVTGL